MTVLGLSRFQFAMTTIFHFFFVPFSIGMGLVVAIMETLYVIKKDEIYKKMAKFWGNIFLLSFAVGVVTGIIQEFQFGMNWSEYSRFVGDIFGAPLAFEALFAFFMESTFLGLWIFTWKKVKPKLHVMFMWLTVLGSLLSAFWILAANAFMQHPVGYTIKDGHAQMISFLALLKNPQVWLEFSHVISAAILMGGILLVGMTAFQILRNKKYIPENKKDNKFYKFSVKLGLILSLFGSAGTVLSGDFQMRYLLNDQPMKFSAMEGVYENTGNPAAWSALGWANEKEHKNDFSLDIPYVLSILSYHKLSGSVEGMNEINKELQEKYGTENNYYPPVNLMYYSFRLMAGFGGLILLLSIIGLFLIRGKSNEPKLFKHKWMLWIMAILTFAPFVVNSAGWIITELGRQPWTVYGLFTTEDSVSPNATVGSLLTSNIVYFLLFTGLTIAMIYLVYRELKKGPQSVEETSDTGNYDPFNKEAF